MRDQLWLHRERSGERALLTTEKGNIAPTPGCGPGSGLQPRGQSDRSEAGLLQFRNERVPATASVPASMDNDDVLNVLLR